jgi:hypothetical protein
MIKTRVSMVFVRKKFSEKNSRQEAQKLMSDVLLSYKSLRTEELVAQLSLVTAIDGDVNVIGKIALMGCSTGLLLCL